MGIPSVFMIVTDVSDAFTNRHPSFEGAVDDHQPRPSNFHCTPLESIPLPYRPAQKLTLQSFDEILLPPILGNDGLVIELGRVAGEFLLIHGQLSSLGFRSALRV